MTLLERFVARRWSLLCVLPLLALSAYQVGKGAAGWHFAGNLGRPESVSLAGLCIVLLALAASLAMVFWQERLRRVVPAVVAGVAVLMTTAVWLQRDPDLAWVGDDVPIYNHAAAFLALEIGPRELIDTWNARANPRVRPNPLPKPEAVLDRIERLHLGWLVGTRWDRVDLPQDNNRMRMHPPGYPLALAAWMKLFGPSRQSAFAFELVVKFCLVLAAVTWATRYVPRDDHLAGMAVALLLATAPPVALFNVSHANELAALLALAAFALACDGPGPRWLRYGFSGALLGAATYTNFIQGITLVAVMLVLAGSRRAWRDPTLTVTRHAVARKP